MHDSATLAVGVDRLACCCLDSFGHAARSSKSALVFHPAKQRHVGGAQFCLAQCSRPKSQQREVPERKPWPSLPLSTAPKMQVLSAKPVMCSIPRAVEIVGTFPRFHRHSFACPATPLQSESASCFSTPADAPPSSQATPTAHIRRSPRQDHLSRDDHSSLKAECTIISGSTASCCSSVFQASHPSPAQGRIGLGVEARIFSSPPRRLPFFSPHPPPASQPAKERRVEKWQNVL